jgi:ParB family chromosome partitioning protein
MGHARALLPLGDEDEQTRLSDRIVAEGLSVRAIESEVAEILRADEVAYAAEGLTDEPTGADAGESPATDEPGRERAATATKRKPGRPATRRSSQTVAVENDLRKALGVKVVVHANGRGAGRIVIPFTDLDEFQRLYDQFCG